jgi:hypothetical protein
MNISRKDSNSSIELLDYAEYDIGPHSLIPSLASGFYNRKDYFLNVVDEYEYSNISSELYAKIIICAKHTEELNDPKVRYEALYNTINRYHVSE